MAPIVIPPSPFVCDISADSVLLIAPRRYVFPGAEVYIGANDYNSFGDDNADSSTSSSDNANTDISSLDSDSGDDGNLDAIYRAGNTPATCPETPTELPNPADSDNDSLDPLHCAEGLSHQRQLGH